MTPAPLLVIARSEATTHSQIERDCFALLAMTAGVSVGRGRWFLR